MFALAAFSTLIIPFVQRRKQWVPPRTMSRRESQAVIKARESVSDFASSGSDSVDKSNEDKSKQEMLRDDEESGVFIDVKENNDKNQEAKQDGKSGDEVVDHYIWVV